MDEVLVVLHLLAKVVDSNEVIDNCALHLQLLDSVSNVSKLVLLSPDKALHLDSLHECDEVFEVDGSTRVFIIVVTVKARRLDVEDNGGLADWGSLLLLGLRTENCKKKLQRQLEQQTH